MQKQIIRFFAFSLILFMFVSNNISAQNEFSGANIWEEGGYIVYEVDFIFETNPDLYTTPVSIGVTNENYEVELIGIDGPLMTFEESSASATLRDYYLNNLLTARYEVDAGTGEYESGVQSRYFHDTTGWEVGEDSSITNTFAYTDDVGFHAEENDYSIDRETSFSVDENDVSKAVEVYELSTADGDFEYRKTEFFTDDTSVVFDYRDYYTGLELVVSKIGGVMLSQSIIFIRYLNIADERPLVQAVLFQEIWKAVEISNVNIFGSSSSETPGLGFIISIVGLIPIAVFRNKRRN